MEEKNINNDEIRRSIVTLASTTYAKVSEISEISNLLDNFLAKNPQNVTVAIYYNNSTYKSKNVLFYQKLLEKGFLYR